MAKTCIKCGRKVVRGYIPGIEATGYFPANEQFLCIKCSQEQAEKEQLAGFTISKRISHYIETQKRNYYLDLCLDDTNKKFAISCCTLVDYDKRSKWDGSFLPAEKIVDYHVWDYSKLNKVEIQEDGQTDSGMGGALVGGLFFGATGAIIGSKAGALKKRVLSLSVILYFDDLNCQRLEIPYIEKTLKTTSSKCTKAFSDAKEVYDALNYIVLQNEKEKTSSPSGTSTSAADEILKFKQLLDSGVITQEEFEAKKKQLLGI